MHAGRGKSKINFKVHFVHLLIFIFIWKDMIFFSQTQFSFKVSLNMLWIDLITINYYCQNLQWAFISEKGKPHPFILVFRTQAKHVFPNFVSVYLYTFKTFSILKQIKGKPGWFSKHQPRGTFPKRLCTLSFTFKELSTLIYYPNISVLRERKTMILY